MASVDATAQSTTSGVNTTELSAAQKLMQKHEAEFHKAIIEDVPDEDDLKHGEQPLSSNILEGTDDVAAPG